MKMTLGERLDRPFVDLRVCLLPATDGMADVTAGAANAAERYFTKFLLSNPMAAMLLLIDARQLCLPRARVISFSCACRANLIRCIFGSKARFFSSPGSA